MNTIQTNLPFHKNTHIYQKDNKLLMRISLNLTRDKYITAILCIDKLPRKEEFFVVKSKRFTVIFIERSILLGDADELKKKHSAMLNTLMILHRRIKIRHLEIEVEQLKFKFL